MTLDQAGKVQEAADSYRAALEVHPGHLPAIQGLASLTLRAGLAEPAVVGWLEEVALRAEERTWRDWAQGRLAKVRAGTE